MNKAQEEEIRKHVKLCGRTLGEHNYIPISKVITKGGEHVAQLMCTRCFCEISIEKIRELFPPIEPQIQNTFS